MENILFVKITVTDGRSNYTNITKYKVHKVTDKRVYYYTIFDEETTKDDIVYIEKERFEKCIIESISSRTIMSSIWCKEEDLTKSKELVAYELEEYLKRLIGNIKKCFLNSKIRIKIKIK